MTLKTDPSRPEGSYRIVRDCPILTRTGGPFSGAIFGVEYLIAQGGNHLARMILPKADVDETPSLTYRTFWTWDHSTNWELGQIGLQ